MIISLFYLLKDTVITSNKMFQTWNDLILVDLEDCGTLETKSPCLKLEKEKKISEKHFSLAVSFELG